MSHSIDDTHDPARRSWVPGADGHPDFPIQNLPLGVFSPHGGKARGGVAIGDRILDLSTLAGLLTGDALNAAEAASGATLNPLLPNYKHIPIAYHGRASSVRASGTPVRRPNGQTNPSDAAPNFGPCQRLDYELELGVWLGPGNSLGEPIPIDRASSHIAGYCLLNDWSARDIQAWEYRPLGPFLAKSFITTVSCWIVTPEAMAPFRIPQSPRPAGDPAPLPYLSHETDQSCGAMDLALEALLSTPDMRQRGLPPHRLALSNARHLYWTTAQMVAHHTSNGCDLRPGDLFGTGTISGTEPGSFGSLLELTLGGRQPITLETGEQRRFLEDGDEIVLLARASRPGFASIGFGECRGQVTPAPQTPR
jgi:fumarylacetoacetase